VLWVQDLVGKVISAEPTFSRETGAADTGMDQRTYHPQQNRVVMMPGLPPSTVSACEARLSDCIADDAQARPTLLG
jgi:hypothetical protein